jgi:hypothetical protein
MGVINSIARKLLAGLDDKSFSKLQYFRNHLRFPNLVTPVGFNEKIIWLKLHYRDPLLQVCADKLQVRDYVAETLDASFLIPLAAVWESPDGIDEATIPDNCVLKATHGSGWNIISRKSDKIDFAAAKKQLKQWLAMDFYEVGREWSYKGLPPRVLCESFLSGPDGESPWDYKLFCYHGKPRFVQVDYNRFGKHTRALYDINWKRLDCSLEYPAPRFNTARPETLGLMLEASRKLSQPFPFCRVDFYEVSGRVYFGEITFYPGKGVERFRPRVYDYVFGSPLNVASLTCG